MAKIHTLLKKLQKRGNGPIISGERFHRKTHEMWQISLLQYYDATFLPYSYKVVLKFVFKNMIRMPKLIDNNRRLYHTELTIDRTATQD